MGSVPSFHKPCGSTYDAKGHCECTDRVVEMRHCHRCGTHYPVGEDHGCEAPRLLLAPTTDSRGE